MTSKVDIMRVGVVIPARNEEKRINITLRMLFSQTLKPSEVVVVDDGSIDRTHEIARKMGAYVVRINRKSKVSRAGTPYMAYVINKGLQYLYDKKLDYVMILGADHVLPKYYLSEITKRMNRENVVVASGIIFGEKVSKTIDVRGSGRVIEVNWFKEVGFKYPLNWGFEAWLIYKALSMGKRVKVYKDLVTYTLRRTAASPLRYYYWGAGMKAMNYHPIYAIGRIFFTFRKSRAKAINLLRGYLAHVDKYEDIKNFVKYMQAKEILFFIYSQFL